MIDEVRLSAQRQPCIAAEWYAAGPLFDLPIGSTSGFTFQLTAPQFDPIDL